MERYYSELCGYFAAAHIPRAEGPTTFKQLPTPLVGTFIYTVWQTVLCVACMYVCMYSTLRGYVIHMSRDSQ